MLIDIRHHFIIRVLFKVFEITDNYLTCASDVVLTEKTGYDFFADYFFG